MARVITLALLLALTTANAREKLRFEGLWKGDRDGQPYVVLTILSDNPLRGTISLGSPVELFIQDMNIVKGKLRFKTIDPSSGLIKYELQILSADEAALSVAGKETVTLKRK